MIENIYISNDKKKLDLKLIHNYLSKESYWAKDRSLEAVKKSIKNSLCFGVYMDGEQVGFARVITDYTIFAWILDVFILPDYQWQGLGKKLMESIVNHKKLQGIKRWGLGTEDAHGLYEKFGFTALKKPGNMMERVSEIES